ncbi:hypothetical protein EH165_09505 [Nakamurella antarctica]|uniref:DUF5709 domain-containing protein n=1 Tax=Nakamurella antarctica TaxID=1902245 RepID=A0A3G8ZLX0_9ACTN|nr:DUF5709 domain-containing protein [Nakamurella antarctica]AZI58339.1 hypothetical protein EH165_09505 [Nakamurella antarctica]
MSEVSFEVSDRDGSRDVNDGGDSSTEQLSAEDTLVDRGLEDPLDEGYSPPDYEPNTKIPTEAEEAQGLSLDELLAAETPDVFERAETEDDSEFEALELGEVRAGRLVDSGDGSYDDNEKSLIAEDVGFSGGAASAEEAAMHIFDPDHNDRF